MVEYSRNEILSRILLLSKAAPREIWAAYGKVMAEDFRLGFYLFNFNEIFNESAKIRDVLSSCISAALNDSMRSDSGKTEPFILNKACEAATDKLASLNMSYAPDSGVIKKVYEDVLELRIYSYLKSCGDLWNAVKSASPQGNMVSMKYLEEVREKCKKEFPMLEDYGFEPFDKALKSAKDFMNVSNAGLDFA